MFKEDIDYVLEELWGYGPEEIFYKIFERETKIGGVDDIFHLTKEDILKLPCRDDATSDAGHVTHSEAGEVRTLQSYRKYLDDQGLTPDITSFCFTSISYEECKNFRRNFNNTLAN